MLIAISSSGRSPNILAAVGAARARGCTVVTLSGFRPDNPLRALGDWNFHVPSEAYGPVEMVHALDLPRARGRAEGAAPWLTAFASTATS